MDSDKDKKDNKEVEGSKLSLGGRTFKPKLNSTAKT